MKAIAMIFSFLYHFFSAADRLAKAADRLASVAEQQAEQLALELQVESTQKLKAAMQPKLEVDA